MYAEQRDPEFGWTGEHRQLRETVRGLLAERAPVSRSRELAESGARHDAALYSALAEQVGLQGLALPERFGGYGGTLLDLAIVAEEMGRVLYGGPFFPTVALAAPALMASADEEACAEYLPRIADGSVTATLAVVEGSGVWSPDDVLTVADAGGRLTGAKFPVLDGVDADLLVVAARGPEGISLYVVEGGAEGLQRSALEILDGTRRMGRVTFDATPARRIGAPGHGWAAVTQAREVASVLMAAEQVGAMAACVELTAEYARTRRQFGRLIGSFQGVKHRLADMAVRLEMSRSAAYWAAWQDPGTEEFAFGAGTARSFCSEACLQTGQDTIQLHGGIGFTWEHDAHLYLRRARADMTVLGTPAQVRAELETTVLAAAAELEPTVATHSIEVPA
ncbi:MAG: acyl-CoA/acyl-ACP dehydrogenase [Pseudonocardia sp.]|nr:acyl-CoA/acyl-ACP dehydrogenase [Pseudonocardia sp.]